VIDVGTDTVFVVDTIRVSLASSPDGLWAEIRSMATPILTGAVAAGIAAWLALRKFRTEKYWEMRLKAYNDILMALDKKLASLHAYLLQMEEHSEMDDSERDKYRIASREGGEEIDRAKRVGKIFLTKQALALLKDIQRRLNESATGIDWRDAYSYMDAHAAEYQKIINDMTTITKSDLNLK